MTFILTCALYVAFSTDHFRTIPLNKENLFVPYPFILTCALYVAFSTDHFRTIPLNKEDLTTLRTYESRADFTTYVAVLREVLAVFGKAIQESLTRTMGQYLEVTGGQLANTNKSEWDKDIAARMICTNNHAEGPFATVRAFLHMYPRLAIPNPDPHPILTFCLTVYLPLTTSMRLKTVAALSAAIVNGTHRVAHKAGNRVVEAGLAITAPTVLKNAVSTICGVRRCTPGKRVHNPNPFAYPEPSRN